MKLNKKLIHPNYIFCLQNDKKWCLYNALGLKKCYGGKELSIIYRLTNDPIKEEILVYKLINCGYHRKEIKRFLHELKKEKFLVYSIFSEEKFREKVRKKLKKIKYQPMGMCFLVSTGCNYRCKYCCLEHSIKIHSLRPKLMSFKIAKEAVDFFFKYSSNPQYICFFGGEPLINFKVIKETVEYINTKYPNKKIFFRINTNGSLVNQEIAKFFAKYNFVIGVSIDGTKKYHNLCRVYQNGKGTFEDTLKGWYLLQKAGCRNLGVVAVLHSQNIDAVEKNILFFLDKLKADSVNFEPVGIITDPKYIYLYPSPKKVAKALIKNYEILESRGKLDNYIARFLIHFLGEKIFFHRCGSRYGSLIIDPEGNKGPCFNFLGSVYFSKKGITYAKEWKNISPVNMLECTKCIAIGICGGICAAHARAVGGNIRSIDLEYSCEIMKEILRWMIWDLEKRLSKISFT